METRKGKAPPGLEYLNLLYNVSNGVHRELEEMDRMLDEMVQLIEE